MSSSQISCCRIKSQIPRRQQPLTWSSISSNAVKFTDTCPMLPIACHELAKYCMTSLSRFHNNPALVVNLPQHRPGAERIVKKFFDELQLRVVCPGLAKSCYAISLTSESGQFRAYIRHLGTNMWSSLYFSVRPTTDLLHNEERHPKVPLLIQYKCYLTSPSSCRRRSFNRMISASLDSVAGALYAGAPP